MFQFTALASYTYWIGCTIIRESRDQRLFDGFPELIAAFHALHRLLTPRHPPHALSSLTTLILASRTASPATTATDWIFPDCSCLSSRAIGRSTSATSVCQLLRTDKRVGNSPCSKSFYLTRSAQKSIYTRSIFEALRIEYKMPLLPLPNLPKNKPQNELP